MLTTSRHRNAESKLLKCFHLWMRGCSHATKYCLQIRFRQECFAPFSQKCRPAVNDSRRHRHWKTQTVRRRSLDAAAIPERCLRASLVRQEHAGDSRTRRQTPQNHKSKQTHRRNRVDRFLRRCLARKTGGTSETKKTEKDVDVLTSSSMGFLRHEQKSTWGKIFPMPHQKMRDTGKFGAKRTSSHPLSLVGLVPTRARLRFTEWYEDHIKTIKVKRNRGKYEIIFHFVIACSR